MGRAVLGEGWGGTVSCKNATPSQITVVFLVIISTVIRRGCRALMQPIATGVVSSMVLCVCLAKP